MACTANNMGEEITENISNKMTVTTKENDETSSKEQGVNLDHIKIECDEWMNECLDVCPKAQVEKTDKPIDETSKHKIIHKPIKDIKYKIQTIKIDTEDDILFDCIDIKVGSDSENEDSVSPTKIGDSAYACDRVMQKEETSLNFGCNQRSQEIISIDDDSDDNFNRLQIVDDVRNRTIDDYGNCREMYKCELCNKSYKLKRHFKAHLSAHKGMKYKCKACNKTFGLKHHLKMHISFNTRENIYKCDMCDTYFVMKCDLRQHRLNHTGAKSYKCEICDRKFTLKQNLVRHMAVHDDMGQHSCKLCSKRFFQKRALQDHMTRHIMKHQCAICHKSYGDKSNFNRHMLKHRAEKYQALNLPNEESFKCEECSEEFLVISSYKRHMLIHNNQKDYKCELCGKYFRTKSDLNKHSLMHTEEKKYKCQFCSKKFRSKSHLNIHVSAHIEIKDFYCKMCDQRFLNNADLSRHTFKQHR